MYKAFYNLTRNPFELTPDPFFLFSTPRHNEALATLYHGVRGRKGFVVLTGDVGTGKTLLLRCLLQLLKQNGDVAYAYSFNRWLSSMEFLQSVARSFARTVSADNKEKILSELSDFVVARGTRKLTTVLVVDEAHHLSTEVLEEIRLLTNLETTQEKLLQVLLVGQPELNDKLDSPALWQLKQRIAHRCQLGPLDFDEAKGYIERRLQLAGSNSNGSPIFADGTIAAIYRHSRGIPRLINTICENALITAYARQQRSVGPAIVEQIAADFRLNLAVVQSSPNVTSGDVEEEHVGRVARKLLDLFGYVGRPRGSSNPELRMPVTIESHKK